MDIQSQVAARRVELERRRSVAQQDMDRAAAEQQVAAKKQRERSLSELATDLSAEAGVDIGVKTDRLAFTRPNALGQLDPDGFKKAELRRMFWREARTEFTPLENTLVIAGISVGLTLMFTESVDTGLIVVFVAGICAYSFLDKHKRRLVADYPQLFGTFGAKSSSQAGGEKDHA
jgi:hypothetical protein